MPTVHGAEEQPPIAMKHEIFLGVVAPVGTPTEAFTACLENELSGAGYRLRQYRISGAIEALASEIGHEVMPFDNEYERVRGLMAASERVRGMLGPTSILRPTIGDVAETRRRGSGDSGYTHVLLTLKTPEEVEVLRDVYGPAFYLVGLHSTASTRREHLKRETGIDQETAEKLIDMDESPAGGMSQNTRDAFEMCDVFLPARGSTAEPAVKRFVELLLGNPFLTPRIDEHGMFLAYAAATRSGSLSRQVGAAILSADGDVLAIGHNDVPAPGGGLYTCESDPDERDAQRGNDSNDLRKKDLIEQIKREIVGEIGSDTDSSLVEKAIRRTDLMGLTEFGRDVHAEMEALVAAARNGRPILEATLFATTFPCHSCAKHIIAAGIRRVVYVEPYPKSLATELFSDALGVEPDGSGSRVQFEPFVGVGARRYFDLFSMKQGVGRRTKRKGTDGYCLPWRRASATLRTPALEGGYEERETVFIHEPVTRPSQR